MDFRSGREAVPYADKNENKNRNRFIDDGAASPVNGISDYRAGTA